ncbi:MAG: acetylornithine transaminase [Candidatus Dormibacterales bacterium]
MTGRESLAEIQELEHRYLMGTFKRLPVAFVRGRGCSVYDSEGKEYLDLVAGIAVNLLGHAHPGLVRAVAEQVQALVHTSNLYYTLPQLALAERLVSLSFPSRVFFSNSGAEANETAIKTARKWGRTRRGGAYRVITAHGAFHGRTLGALAATGQPKYQERFQPLPEGFDHVPYNDLDALRAATGPETAAVMLEPVMGEVGVVPAAPGYLEGVRAWCDERDLLFILDEVQTGLGRTGRWFAHQHHGVKPDVMTLAKGLGGGVPIGACLAAPRADVLEAGDHGATFGGGPLACAAGLAVLGTIESEGLVGRAERVGAQLAAGLAELPGVSGVRGRGLMLGVALEGGASALQAACLERGLIVNAIGETTLRLVPPLILEPGHVERALATFEQALAVAR